MRSKGIEKTKDRGQVVDKIRKTPDPHKSFTHKFDREKTLCGVLFKAQDQGQVTGNEFFFIVVLGH